MQRLSSTSRKYARRDRERSALHQTVREHLETFLAETRTTDRDGVGVPAFVEAELRRFLECGVLAHGFARFRCDACGTDRLVAFSCKGRGFCPSCGGRRMTAQAAHLVDEVLPPVRMRQWVLSLPFELRYRLAFDHELGRAVLAVFTRAIFGFLRDRAKKRGHPGGQAGSVTVIQRFGGALNLNPHFHTLIPDGVFLEASDGSVRFHRLPPPTDEEVAALLTTLVARLRRLLIRRGVWREGDDGTDYVDPTLHERLGAAAIQQVALTGPRALLSTRRIRTAPPKTSPKVLGRRRARQDGFDLHANTAVRGKNRPRLERICRYLLRPPVSESRIELRGDRVLLTLKTPYDDGTTHLSFEPTELLGRLAALVPRPQKNLLLYHGVFAANAKLRRRVVVYGRPSEPGKGPKHSTSKRKRHNPSWAELMRRGLDIDSLECPKCHARMRFVASILRPATIRRILESLDLPAEPVVPAPARAPPNDDDLFFDVA